MSSNEITALITLIEDPDEAIFTQVRNELVSYGEAVIPWLERYWEMNSYGELFQERVEKLIQSIHFDCVREKILQWKNSDDQDLLEGMLILNRYQYPSIDEEEVKRALYKVRQDIWLELNDNLTALEIVRVFNHILYQVHSFKGSKQNHVSPELSYLSDVLTNKNGNPLSLATLYVLLAESLDVPIYGVNLPNHFILCYKDENSLAVKLQEDNKDGILFYINPFSGGTIIHRNEIDDFLMHLNLPKKVSYYQSCSNMDIMNRMLNNLIFAYTQKGKIEKVDELQRLQELLVKSEVEKND